MGVRALGPCGRTTEIRELAAQIAFKRLKPAVRRPSERTAADGACDGLDSGGTVTQHGTTLLLETPYARWGAAAVSFCTPLETPLAGGLCREESAGVGAAAGCVGGLIYDLVTRNKK